MSSPWEDYGGGTATAEPTPIPTGGPWEDFKAPAQQSAGPWDDFPKPPPPSDTPASDQAAVQTPDALGIAAATAYGQRMGGPTTVEVATQMAAQPQWLRNAQDAAAEVMGGFVPKTAQAVADFLTPVASLPAEAKQLYGAAHRLIAGEPLDQVIKQQYPESQQLAQAEQTPAYSKERFAAGFGTIANLVMGAQITHGLGGPAVVERPGAPVAEVPAGTEAPPVQPSQVPPTPETPVPEAMPSETVPAKAEVPLVEAAPEAASTQEPIIQAEPAPESFTTSQGSTYQVHEDGTTTRTKSAHPETPGDEGLKPRSSATFYVTPEQAVQLGEVQARGVRSELAQLPDGRWGVRYLEGPDAGKFEGRTVTDVSDTPVVGLQPVEVWEGQTQPHFGNQITEIKAAEPAPPAGAPEAKATKSLPPQGTEIGEAFFQHPNVRNSEVLPDGSIAIAKFSESHGELIDRLEENGKITEEQARQMENDPSTRGWIWDKDPRTNVTAPELQATQGDLYKAFESKMPAPEAAKPPAVAPPVEPPLTAGAAEEPAPSPGETGASAASFEQTYGKGEIPVGPSVSAEDIYNQGAADLARGDDPYAFADRARVGNVSPTELGLLAAEHNRLVTEAAALEGKPGYEAAYQRAKDFAGNMLKPAGNRWHQTGIGLQVKAPIDYSNLTGFRRAVEENLKREMTPSETVQFRKAAKDVGTAKAETATESVRTGQRIQKRYRAVKDISFEEAAKQMRDSIAKAVEECNL